MPVHSDYFSIYRYGGYQPQVHMSVYVPQVLWSGELTATPDNPAKQIEVDYDVDPTFTGNVAPPGYYCAQIIFRDPVTNKRKGVGRVADTRQTAPLDDTTHINIREFGLGQGSIEDGDLFEIVAFYPLDTKLIADFAILYFDQLFCPDGRLHSHEGEDPSPIANSGGHWAGWVYPGQTHAVVPGYGSRSFQTDPDTLAVTPGHVWTPLTSGITNIGSSTGADPTFWTDPGSHCVNHRVDGGSTVWTGKQSYSNVYHIVHDADNPPHEVILTNYAGDTETGINWTAEVISGDVDTETIPDGAFVILWVDDNFVTPRNPGINPETMYRFNETFYSFRSHMIGQGYVRRLTESKDGGSGVGRLTLEIQSPLSKLAEITSYSHFMIEGSGTFAEWQVIKTLGVKRAILELWEYYTTGMEAGIDFLVSDTFSDARYPQFYIQRSDTVTQMRELAYARNGIITAVERGAAIELKCHPALVELGDRP